MKVSKCISWNNLDSVYRNKRLQKLVETLEVSLNVVDESSLFAKLVNTSVSKSLPFHRWVRYREGYAGELVKEILGRHSIDTQRDFVLDPMCGSGSTNVACKESGIDSIGLDVNPFAILATKIKTHQTNISVIGLMHEQKKKIISQFKKSKDVAFNDFETSIIKYFNDSNLKDLVKLKNIIKDFTEGYTSDFFKLALLAIVEDCSDRKKDGNGLATRKSPVLFVLSRFIEQCDQMLEDLSLDIPENVKTFAVCSSAKRMDEAINDAKRKFDKSLGCIIFSPPYANSFDYFESYKLELVFGEYTELENLFDFRKELIRNYRLSHKQNIISKFEIVNLLAKEIFQRIPEKEAVTGTRDGRTRLVPNMLGAYFEDMNKVIQNCYSALRKDGTLHIVVDQSAYVGVPIPTDNILALIGLKNGFKVKSVTKCRRAATSGQQLKEYSFLKNLLRETIISFIKN